MKKLFGESALVHAATAYDRRQIEALEAGRAWAVEQGGAEGSALELAASIYADDKARVADDTHFRALREQFVAGAAPAR